MKPVEGTILTVAKDAAKAAVNLLRIYFIFSFDIFTETSK
jgi:hypothetical protein